MVTWLLIVPHALILLPLWIGFWLLSLVALVAIMVTGWYPRWIFVHVARACSGSGGRGPRAPPARDPTCPAAPADARGSRMMPGLHPP